VPAPAPPPAARRVTRAWTVAGAFAAVALAVVILLVVSGGGQPSALAVGRAIVLRSADLPGFRFVGVRHADGGPSGVSGYPQAQCLGSDADGGKNSVLVLSSAVAQNNDGVQTVISTVIVKPSTAAVARDFAVFSSPAVLSCIGQGVQSEAETAAAESGQQETVSDVQTTEVPFSAPGSNATFGWHVSATANYTGASVPIVMEVRGFAIGRDEVELLTESVGEQIPAATEQKLASVLLHRALAQA
jgi:hypothetical protein